jgi:hypothetical protein
MRSIEFNASILRIRRGLGGATQTVARQSEIEEDAQRPEHCVSFHTNFPKKKKKTASLSHWTSCMLTCEASALANDIPESGHFRFLRAACLGIRSLSFSSRCLFS